MADKIPFPFEPYPQQRDLMKSIFNCVETSSVGCFESPTGTGKSLSVICATLSWQFQEEKRILEEHEASQLNNKVDDGDDWLMAFESSFKKDTAESKEIKRLYDRHIAMKERVRQASLSGQRQRVRIHQVNKKFVKSADLEKGIETDTSIFDRVMEPEDEFSLRHYDSDEDNKGLAGAKKGHRSGGNSNLDHIDSEDEEECSNALRLPKIFYCSRTHSQISQFVTEIKRTAFSSARCVTLGSRRNLCINPEVNNLGSDSRMSERCLEKQKSKSRAKVAAEYTNGSIVEPAQRKQKTKVLEMKPCLYHNKSKESEFADQALGKIRDIESLAALGNELEACPYYATRGALKSAQIVCMPYNMLLHNDLRSSMGIDLTNNVVIFDEAHNLVEAVNHIYSAEVSLDQLTLAGQCVEDYLQRFQTVLMGKNYYYVNILISVINGFKRSLKSDQKQGVSPQIKQTVPLAAPILTLEGPALDVEILGVNDFIFRIGLDNVNLFKLKRHFTETHLDHKVGGFADHQAKKKEEEEALVAVLIRAKGQKGDKDSVASRRVATGCCGNTGSGGLSVSPSDGDSKVVYSLGQYTQSLRAVLALITCLTNVDIDGRIVISQLQTSIAQHSSSELQCPATIAPSPSIKFILLNPSVHFQKIVDQARSVLLLGGTLQPFSYVKSFLFPKVPSESLSLFSCGHVVDRANILALVASAGPRGWKLEFTHTSRMERNALTELHNSLKQISSVVPNGIVVFFTSYQYMSAVQAKWKDLGIYNELTTARALYVEPRQAAEAERVWLAYSEQALAIGGRGAMLFCVMGGKLSEGINFSDKLARCVVVIGMPYPDGRDAVLQEKLKFACLVEKNEKAGRMLYEAMCMRTVNQCIGRAIRHINDYSAIVLLDGRYAQTRVTSQLPSWLSSEVHHCLLFQEVTTKLKAFFSSRLEENAKIKNAKQSI